MSNKVDKKTKPAKTKNEKSQDVQKDKKPAKKGSEAGGKPGEGRTGTGLGSTDS